MTTWTTPAESRPCCRCKRAVKLSADLHVSLPVWSPPLIHFSSLFPACPRVVLRLPLAYSPQGLSRVPARGTAVCQAQPGCQECISSSIPPTQPRRPTLAQPKLHPARRPFLPGLPSFSFIPSSQNSDSFPPCLLSHHRSSTHNNLFLTSPSYLLD